MYLGYFLSYLWKIVFFFVQQIINFISINL